MTQVMKFKFCFILWLILCGLPMQILAIEQNDKSLESKSQVELFFFGSRYCPHCRAAKPFLQQLENKYHWLTVHHYDLVNHPENQKRFVQMAAQLNQSANSVPAFIFCGQMQVGYDSDATTGAALEQQLLECKQTSKHKTSDLPISIPGLDGLNLNTLSMPLITVLIAGMDAFNPCAFFVLFFLLSLMALHRSRTRMLTVGLTFVVCSGVMYFLFMVAWLNVFLFFEQLIYLTVIAGGLALLIGLINIKDYFYFKQGVSLTISATAQQKLFARMRSISQAESPWLMLAATVILAIAANSYELLCTAGLPMVYTRLLTIHHLSGIEYYAYLVLYNVVYVIPLFIIVAGFTFSLGRKKLTEFQGRVLKLFSGVMMSEFGLLLLMNPESMNQLGVSVAVLAIAVLLTLVIAWPASAANNN